MNRAAVVFACLLMSGLLPACAQQTPAPPAKSASFDYDQAYRHELKPHRRTIPLEGVKGGFNQIRITLTVSSNGDVVNADSSSQSEQFKYWPQLKDEVLGWKFSPFEVLGKPVTARVEEYVDLVPPERLPTTHVIPPGLRRDSSVSISLQRGGCYGRCPAYTVRVNTSGIIFDGDAFVAAKDKHTAAVDPEAVRKLAARFIAADFYSMGPSYIASVTDNSTYILSITVDGHKKEVVDYVGQWEGMPAVIKELEDAVDELAQTRRWIKSPQ
jgi:hypothetical protein